MLSQNGPRPVPQSLFKSCLVKGPDGKEYEALLPVPLPNSDGTPEAAQVSTEEALVNAKTLIPLHKNATNSLEPSSVVLQSASQVQVQQQNDTKQVKVIPVKIPRSALSAALTSGKSIHLNSLPSVSAPMKTKIVVSDNTTLDASTLQSGSAKFIVVPSSQGGLQKIVTMSKQTAVVTNSSQSLLRTSVMANQSAGLVEVRKVQSPTVVTAGGNTNVTYVSNPKMATSHSGSVMFNSSVRNVNAEINNDKLSHPMTYCIGTNPQAKLGTQRMVPVASASLLKPTSSTSVTASNTPILASQLSSVNGTSIPPQMVHLPPLPPGYVYAVHNSPVTVVNTPSIQSAPTMTTPVIQNTVQNIIAAPPVPTPQLPQLSSHSNLQTIKINGQSYTITNEELAKFVKAAQSAGTAKTVNTPGVVMQPPASSQVAQQIAVVSDGFYNSKAPVTTPYIVSSGPANHVNLMSKPPKAVIAVTDPSVLKNLQTLTSEGKKCFIVKKSTAPLPTATSTTMTTQTQSSVSDRWLKEILSKLSPPKSSLLKSYEGKSNLTNTVEQGFAHYAKNKFASTITSHNYNDNEIEIADSETIDDDNNSDFEADPSQFLEPVVEIIEEKGKSVIIPNLTSPWKMVRKENMMPKRAYKRRRNGSMNASAKRFKLSSQKISSLQLDLTALPEYRAKGLNIKNLNIASIIRKNVPLPKNQKLEFIWCNYDSRVKLKECHVRLERFDMNRLVDGRLNLEKHNKDDGESHAESMVRSRESKTAVTEVPLLSEEQIKKETMDDDVVAVENECSRGSTPSEDSVSTSKESGNSRVQLLRERLKKSFAATNELKQKNLKELC